MRTHISRDAQTLWPIPLVVYSSRKMSEEEFGIHAMLRRTDGISKGGANASSCMTSVNIQKACHKCVLQLFPTVTAFQVDSWPRDFGLVTPY